VLAFFDDCLVGDEDATVQLRSEIADEFFAALHVLVHKYVLEVVQKWLLEQLRYQLEPQIGLQLLKELKPFHQLLMIMRKTLLDVDLYFVI